MTRLVTMYPDPGEGVNRPRAFWRLQSLRGWSSGEHATLEYVDWFNHRRLLGELGMIAPAELEAIYYHQPAPALLATSQ